MNGAFFGDLLQTISDRGRKFLSRRTNAVTRSADFVVLCEDLLSGRGEASGVALAREILNRYAALTIGPRTAFFEALAQQFGPDRVRMEKAIAAWQANPTDVTASSSIRPPSRAGRSCSAGSISRRAAPQRSCGCANNCSTPWRTVATLRLWTPISSICSRPGSIAASWCCGDIDWSTPANILEKIIKHEAVHKIRSWDDLRRRIDPDDRCCFAFFHPALVDEPLIFVEVALTDGMPGSIAPILTASREPLEASQVDTAVFYSISNCQHGLAGVSFGNFLIKQVVEEVSREQSAPQDLRDAVAGSGFCELAEA